MRTLVLYPFGGKCVLVCVCPTCVSLCVFMHMEQEVDMNYHIQLFYAIHSETESLTELRGHQFGWPVSSQDPPASTSWC